MIDHIPHWLGGLPEGVPPRPGTPEYEAWQAEGRSRDKGEEPTRRHERALCWQRAVETRHASSRCGGRFGTWARFVKRVIRASN
jgi:hypothetical protein